MNWATSNRIGGDYDRGNNVEEFCKLYPDIIRSGMSILLFDIEVTRLVNQLNISGIEAKEILKRNIPSHYHLSNSFHKLGLV